MLTTRPFWNSPAVHFHMMPDGQPHVHEHFTPASHGSHRVVAICGKGGVGKTAVSALATKDLARRPEAGRLLVIDADPAFGLALALGIAPDKTLASVRDELLSAAQSGSAAAEQEMADKLDYLVFESLIETDDFAFLAMGRSRDLGCYCSVNDLLRDAVDVLAQDFDTILIDGEAGLEQINRQVVAALDDLVIVSDGSNRAARTIETLWDMAEENNLVPHSRIFVVLNRQETGASTASLREGVHPHVLGSVPADQAVAAADRAEQPLVNLPDDNPAVHAVSHIVSHLLAH